MIGIVARWGSKAFGFIRSDGIDREAFFNQYNIETPGWIPRCHDEVEFEPSWRLDGSIVANHVKRLKSAYSRIEGQTVQVSTPANEPAPISCSPGPFESHKPSNSIEADSPESQIEEIVPLQEAAFEESHDSVDQADVEPIAKAAERQILHKAATLGALLDALGVEGRREEKLLRTEVQNLQDEADSQADRAEQAKFRLVESQRDYIEESKKLQKLQESRLQATSVVDSLPEKLVERRRDAIAGWFSDAGARLHELVHGQCHLQQEADRYRADALKQKGDDVVRKYEAARVRARAERRDLEREAFSALEAVLECQVLEYAQALRRFEEAGKVAVPLVVLTPAQPDEPLLMVTGVPVQEALHEDPFWRLTCAFCEVVREVSDKERPPEIGSAWGCLAAQVRCTHSTELLEIAIAQAWEGRPSLQVTGLAFHVEEYSGISTVFTPLQDAPESPCIVSSPAGGSLRAVADRTGVLLPELLDLLRTLGITAKDDQISEDVEGTLHQLLGMRVPAKGDQLADVSAPQVDPASPLGLAGTILDKMLRNRNVGGRHTGIENLHAHGLPDDLKDRAFDVMERLMTLGILLPKQNEGARHASINPRKLRDVHEIIAGRWKGDLE